LWEQIHNGGSLSKGGGSEQDPIPPGDLKNRKTPVGQSGESTHILSISRNRVKIKSDCVWFKCDLEIRINEIKSFIRLVVNRPIQFVGSGYISLGILLTLAAFILLISGIAHDMLKISEVVKLLLTLLFPAGVSFIIYGLERNEGE
jgi:hypothetical protein